MSYDPSQGGSKNVDPAEYRVPRNFKLLAELESAEKGAYTDAKKYGDDCNWITVGLDGSDATFTHWNASIIPHQGGHIGDRIYSLKITAGPGYPDDPPLIRFVNQVAIPCVDNKGIVQFNKMTSFNWDREKDIFDALMAVRKEMQPGPVAQACSKISADKTY